MALALSAAPLLGVELSAEDVLLERQAPPKLVHNVAVCSRWSPRYEALHVLPWLAHHNLLGVDHFFMYLAPPYTNASSPLELRVRALVAASPMVTLLQTDRVPTILGSASEGTRSLDTEGVSLVDCMQRLRRSARWGDPYQPRARRGSGRHDPPHHRTPRHRARRPTERSELGCWPVGDGQHLLYL